jgi:hypothetical protein
MVRSARQLRESSDGESDELALAHVEQLPPLSRAGRVALFGLEQALLGGLEELGLDDPEEWFLSVRRSLAAWRSDWPPDNLTWTIDRDFLYDGHTREFRRKALLNLPRQLRPNGVHAKRYARALNEAAQRLGVTMNSLEVAWPDHEPVY